MKDRKNIMDELAAYGIARSVAAEMSNHGQQEGTPLFNFKDVGDEYEITAGPIEALEEYNCDLFITAPEASEFNLIVRKDVPGALHTLPKEKLRAALTRILDSV